MTTFVYGTGNPAKVSSMQAALAPLGIRVIGARDTGIALPIVDESGSTPLENARIKAMAYFRVLQQPVFACDSGLYIDGLPDEQQPGVHIRRGNGKRLTDDEMTDYYAALAARMGGKVTARYRNAICLVVSESEVYEHCGDDLCSEAFYLVAVPHPRRVDGFPLDRLSVHIASGKYYYDGARPAGDMGIMDKGFQDFFRQCCSSML